MSGTRTNAPVPLRTALHWTGAVLIAYVGLVHEVIGARLYPDGPALMGGAVPWHFLGVAGIAAGLALVADCAGLVTAPRRALALLIGVAGLGAMAGDAVVHGGFHFFAATLVVAALLVACGPPRSAPEGSG
jgi:hypothetical protein